MFEYLELRSSILLTEINSLLQRLRGEQGSGRAWKAICSELKEKQEELELVFERIRVEIEATSSERASREYLLRHFESTVHSLMH